MVMALLGRSHTQSARSDTEQDHHLSFEDDNESASRTSGGAGSKGKKSRKKNMKHRHVGPNARAFRSGLAFCPECDAEKILRPTDVELIAQRSVKEAQKASRSTTRR
jgi:hypothetical protein